MTQTPTITDIEVIPVAGRDGMLMNLSGAHAPFFTRNVLLIHDSAGRTGVGEGPGGEGIRPTVNVTVEEVADGLWSVGGTKLTIAEIERRRAERRAAGGA